MTLRPLLLAFVLAACGGHHAPLTQNKPPPGAPGPTEPATPTEGAGSGIEATSGTGGVDRDLDGIADAADKCADDPEDLDGFEDEDGCPEVDNDKDGIPDSADSCPNLAESKNGRDDTDGCPE